MKRIILLTLIFLPALTMAQKGDNKTVKEFFDKYSGINGYSSVEVTEDMFEMFTELDEADTEMVQFMKKLKFVRYMEYKDGPTNAVGWVQSGSDKGLSSTYFVDGKEIKSTGIGQTTNWYAASDDEKKNSKKKKKKTETSPSVVQVNSSKADNVSTVAGTPINVYGASKSVVHDRAIDEINLKGFKTLMKSKQNGEKITFLRRDWTSEPNDTEFLLISGNTLIHIRGDLNIKHLYELEEIIQAVGDILPQ